MNIKTVIFDIGGVLTDTDWDALLLEIAGTPEAVEKLADVMFHSGIWLKMDGGLLEEDEVLEAFLKEGQGIEEQVMAFWEQSGGRLFQCDFAKPLIRDLKARGYQVLYLSNWSSRYRKVCAKAMDFLELMDGGVFSYQEKVIKPNPEIYKRIIKKYDLIPEECVFLDDSLDNVNAARALGIHGVHIVDHNVKTVDDIFMKNNLQ